MTIEPCFFCGVDSVAMCRICEKRVCNRHMVMAVARINIYVSQGFPVALTHPQGETRTSVAGGAYLEGFERGPARCLGCRERDGRQSLAASRDLSGLSLGAALAEISTHTTAEESRKAALHREYDDALRQLDELTAQAVSDFLGAAGRIESRPQKPWSSRSHSRRTSSTHIKLALEIMTRKKSTCCRTGVSYSARWVLIR